jgi:hypothetical protein
VGGRSLGQRDVGRAVLKGLRHTEISQGSQRDLTGDQEIKRLLNS